MVTVTESDPPPAYPAQAAAIPAQSMVAISTTINPDTADHLLVSVVPPKMPFIVGTEKLGSRAPVDICCVIDVSGSMNDLAPAPLEGGKNEQTGLSVLDVVKHAVRTIISTVKEGDRISIVTFSDDAKVKCGFTEMTESGKKHVLEAVQGLVPENMTNLWVGLKTGMQLFRDRRGKTTGGLDPSTATPATSVVNSVSPHPDEEKVDIKMQSNQTETFDPKRVSALLLLTDGMPNVEPPRGHIPMLKSYLDACPDKDFIISTFGFGYQLNSQLLNEISEVGNGSFGFIPDAGMVGTVFVHAVANLYATFAGSVIVEIEVGDGMEEKVDSVPGSVSAVKSDWGVKVHIGELQYGQTKDLIVKLKDRWDGHSPEIRVTATYRPWTLDPAYAPYKTSWTMPPSLQGVAPNPDVVYHTKRLELVSAIRSILHKKGRRAFPLGQPAIPQIASAIRQQIPNHAVALALAEDVEGQVSLALSKAEFFNRWGVHYLYSLSSAHRRQQCGNFKDPGLQVYGIGSDVFLKARNELDKAFDDLPPPKPSARSRAHGVISAARSGPGAPRTHASYYTPTTTMSIYNSSSAPCFAGDCPLLLEDGSTVRLDRARRGLRISGGGVVAAILRTEVPGGVDLCAIGRLKITPWHPIYHLGRWVFPSSISEPFRAQDVNAVYSVLLRKGDEGDVVVGGVRCVSLGHGVREAHDDVRAHPFFGNWDAVVRGLSTLPGFEGYDGIVKCDGVGRCPRTGLVDGFVSPAVIVIEEGSGRVADRLLQEVF